MRISTASKAGRSVTFRVLFVVFALAAPLGLAIADGPSKKTLTKPNLLAAQKLAAQAHAKLVAAEQAYEYDAGGNAQHARQLLEQANAAIDRAVKQAGAGKKPPP